MATINISIPQGMYEDAKKLMVKKRYASISELVRDGLRKIMYPELTENGFTKEFEDEVLRRSALPDDNDIALETDEDIHNYFLHLKKPSPKRHDKSTIAGEF